MLPLYVSPALGFLAIRSSDNGRKDEQAENANTPEGDKRTEFTLWHLLPLSVWAGIFYTVGWTISEWWKVGTYVAEESKPPVWSFKDGSQRPVWQSRYEGERPVWKFKGEDKQPVRQFEDGITGPVWKFKDGSMEPVWKFKNGGTEPVRQVGDESEDPKWKPTDEREILYPESKSDHQSDKRMEELEQDIIEAKFELCDIEDEVLSQQSKILARVRRLENGWFKEHRKSLGAKPDFEVCRPSKTPTNLDPCPVARVRAQLYSREKTSLEKIERGAERAVHVRTELGGIGRRPVRISPSQFRGLMTLARWMPKL